MTDNDLTKFVFITFWTIMISVIGESNRALPKIPSGSIVNNHFVTYPGSLQGCKVLQQDIIAIPGIQELKKVVPSIKRLQQRATSWYLGHLQTYKTMESSDEFTKHENRFFKVTTMEPYKQIAYKCFDVDATLTEVQTQSDLDTISNLLKATKARPTTIWQPINPLIPYFPSGKPIPTFLDRENLKGSYDEIKDKCIALNVTKGQYELANCETSYHGVCESKLSDTLLFQQQLTNTNLVTQTKLFMNSLEKVENYIAKISSNDQLSQSAIQKTLLDAETFENLDDVDVSDNKALNIIAQHLQDSTQHLELLNRMITSKDPTVLRLLTDCDPDCSQVDLSTTVVETVEKLGHKIQIQAKRLTECEEYKIMNVYPLTGGPEGQQLSGKYIRTSSDCYHLNDNVQPNDRVHLDENKKNQCCRAIFNKEVPTNCSNNAVIKDFQTTTIQDSYTLLNLHNEEITWCDTTLKATKPILINPYRDPNCTLTSERYNAKFQGKAYEIVDGQYVQLQLPNDGLLTTLSEYFPLVGAIAGIVTVLMAGITLICMCKRRRENRNQQLPNAAELQPINVNDGQIAIIPGRAGSRANSLPAISRAPSSILRSGRSRTQSRTRRTSTDSDNS